MARRGCPFRFTVSVVTAASYGANRRKHKPAIHLHSIIQKAFAPHAETLLLLICCNGASGKNTELPMLNSTGARPSKTSVRDRMRTLILSLLIGAVSAPAQAQLFSQEALGGAALGGIIGGVIGHNNGRHTAEGAGIGAGAGLLLGALMGQARRDAYASGADSAYYAPASVYASPAPVYAAPRPNYAVTGAVLGGIAGGVIGHNNGRHTAEGIAIGAGSGLLLGAIAESAARRQERAAYIVSTPAYYTAAPQPQASATAEPPPVQVNAPVPVPAPASSMAAANSLFGR
jgi:outer membrane lipoprotein SlyB